MGDAATDAAAMDTAPASSLTDVLTAANLEHLITAGVIGWILYRAFVGHKHTAPTPKRRRRKKKKTFSLLPSFARTA